MGKMKSLKIVLLVLAVVLVLVIFKTVGKNGFKNDAKSTIVAVNSNNFMISVNDLEKNKSEFLIVELDEPGSQRFENSLKIPFEKLLEETNLQKLKDSDKKIILVSADISTGSKAWVILNQLDIVNVFVFSNDENPEVLKYEFQPDAAARLESVTEN
jgi:hypothetical protein